MKSRFLACAGALVLFFMVAALGAEQATTDNKSEAALASTRKEREPLSRRDLQALLKAGVSPRRMEVLVRQYGVSFEMTEVAEDQLRRAGATEPLLKVIRDVAPKHPAPAAPPPATLLVIDSSPVDAQVYVDDEPEGTTGPEGMLKLSRLPPGNHKIRLSAPGYADRMRNVQLSPEGSTHLVVSLESVKRQTAAALEPKPDVESAPDRGLALPVPASGRVWKSVTTGKEYRVRLERDLLHAEWINISPALAKGGAYIRSELRRAGTKWAGTSRLHLPCESVEDNKPVRNWCLLETRIEIDAITSDRITGRGESLRRFDCRVCKILETRWAKFEWVPEGQKAGGGTR